MAAYCNRCGRDRFDEAEHEVDHITTDGGVIRRRRCLNLVLVADQTARDLVTGESRLVKRYVPDTPQRTRANRTRWIHRDTLAAIERNTQ